MGEPGTTVVVLGRPARVPGDPVNSILVVACMTAIAVAAVFSPLHSVWRLLIGVPFGGLAVLVGGVLVAEWWARIESVAISADAIVGRDRRDRERWRLPLAGLGSIGIMSKNRRVSTDPRGMGKAIVVGLWLMAEAPAGYAAAHPELSRYRAGRAHPELVQFRTQSDGDVTYSMSLGNRAALAEVMSRTLRRHCAMWQPAYGPVADRRNSPREW